MKLSLTRTFVLAIPQFEKVFFTAQVFFIKGLLSIWIVQGLCVQLLQRYNFILAYNLQF